MQTVTVDWAGITTSPSSTRNYPACRITKYERGTMTLMPNVSFEIFRLESLGIFTTDEFGQILLTNCEPGTYGPRTGHWRDIGHAGYHAPGGGVKAGTASRAGFFNDRLPGIHLIKVGQRRPVPAHRQRPLPGEAVDGSGTGEYHLGDGTIDLSNSPWALMS